jgi:hypothetical protein
MTSNLPLPDDKKLKVTYRVEPGCLGPEGKDHIRKFCVFAEKAVSTMDADFVRWHIVPRFSKAVSELRYTVDRKQLSHEMADKYLRVFGKSLSEFEEHLQDKLALLVDEYFQRR